MYRLKGLYNYNQFETIHVSIIFDLVPIPIVTSIPSKKNNDARGTVGQGRVRWHAPLIGSHGHFRSSRDPADPTGGAFQ